MLPDLFTIEGDFPPATYEQWRALAEAELKGASFEQKLVTHACEGVDIRPLCTKRDHPGDEGLPGSPPFVRGSRPLGAVATGWDLRQEHAHPDLTVTNRAILEDLFGGVTSILLRFDLAARDGFDPDDPAANELAGRDGVMAFSVADLDAALSHVELPMVGIALDARAAFLPAAALLVALWRKRKVAPDQARGAFNADPLAVLAREGQLPLQPAAAMNLVADLAKWTSKNYPNVTAVAVDSSPYYHAGATAAQDIAFAIAAGVEYLRAMTSAGLNIDKAAAQITFNFSLGTHHFLDISKFRAARRVWSRIVEACGGSPPAGAMHIAARISRSVLTERDPYVNLLRNTVAVFAAGLGGAESITSLPFDSAIGLPDDFSRRIARNTVLILQEEAQLHRVIDQAGGSWFLDSLTEELADKAWEVFQQIERQGGMLKALQSGWAATQINSASVRRVKVSAGCKTVRAGISDLPDVGESPVTRAAPDARALREAAAGRITSSRRETKSLAAIAAQPDRTEAAVNAAAEGATIGQIARALGFHREPYEIQPLKLLSEAKPSGDVRNACGSERKEC